MVMLFAEPPVTSKPASQLCDKFAYATASLSISKKASTAFRGRLVVDVLGEGTTIAPDFG